MGRSRSRILTQYLKEQKRRHRVFMQAIKPPWLCPWCIPHNEDGFLADTPQTMIYKYDGKSRLHSQRILVYCTVCNQGESMPLTPILDPVDYYGCVIDNVFTGKVPRFVLPESWIVDQPISLGVIV